MKPNCRASTYVDKNVVAAYLDRVAFDAHCGVGYQLAAADVVLPAVPGTRHHVAFQIPFRQRASAMETYIIDSADLAADVGDCQYLALELELAHRAFRHFRLL